MSEDEKTLAEKLEELFATRPGEEMDDYDAPYRNANGRVIPMQGLTLTAKDAASRTKMHLKTERAQDLINNLCKQIEKAAGYGQSKLWIEREKLDFASEKYGKRLGAMVRTALRDAGYQILHADEPGRVTEGISWENAEAERSGTSQTTGLTVPFTGHDAWMCIREHEQQKELQKVELAQGVLESLAAKIQEAADYGEVRIQMNPNFVNYSHHVYVGDYVQKALQAAGYEVYEQGEQDPVMIISWAEQAREDRVAESGQYLSFEDMDDSLIAGDDNPPKAVEEEELDLGH